MRTWWRIRNKNFFSDSLDYFVKVILDSFIKKALYKLGVDTRLS
jgi:hypothetical protein